MELVQGKMMPSAAEGGAYALRKIVAVVDDDPGILRALVSWLAYYQLRATHHSSGESLLSLLRARDGNLLMTVDVMDAVPFVLAGAVLDVNLAGISFVPTLAYRGGHRPAGRCPGPLRRAARGGAVLA